MTAGGIVTLNVLNSNGGFVNFGLVQQQSAAAGIHLRTGCFCNPGACQVLVDCCHYNDDDDGDDDDSSNEADVVEWIVIMFNVVRVLNV